MPETDHKGTSNIHVARRRNALSLFQEFAETQVSAGTSPKGLEQAFAEKLEISPSMWSQLKSKRVIGDKLAHQIERHCDKPPGWLDEDRPAAGLTPGEQLALALMLKAWRATNSDGRKRLRSLLRDVAEGKAFNAT